MFLYLLIMLARVAPALMVLYRAERAFKLMTPKGLVTLVQEVAAIVLLVQMVR